MAEDEPQARSESPATAADSTEVLERVASALSLSADQASHAIAAALSDEEPQEALIRLLGFEHIDDIFFIIRHSYLFASPLSSDDDHLLIRHSIPPVSPLSVDPTSLVSTSVLGPTLSSVFPFSSFNAVQSAVFEAVWSDTLLRNILVAAPTGAGKTEIALLAIIRSLVYSTHCSELKHLRSQYQHTLSSSAKPSHQHMKGKKYNKSKNFDARNAMINTNSNQQKIQEAPEGGKESCAAVTQPGSYSPRAGEWTPKAVYVAPMRALATEISRKLRRALSPLGLSVEEYTGDIQTDSAAVNAASVIVCTPEKLDVATRRLCAPITAIRLVIIDEIHMLGDARGPVLESLVARLKMISERTQTPVRVVGLSATLPNVNDVARFISAHWVFRFGPEYRPVPLHTEIIGFKQKTRRAEKESWLLSQLRKLTQDNRQVLVFVGSRAMTGALARLIARDSPLSAAKSSKADEAVSEYYYYDGHGGDRVYQPKEGRQRRSRKNEKKEGDRRGSSRATNSVVSTYTKTVANENGEEEELVFAADISNTANDTMPGEQKGSAGAGGLSGSFAGSFANLKLTEKSGRQDAVQSITTDSCKNSVRKLSVAKREPEKDGADGARSNTADIRARAEKRKPAESHSRAVEDLLEDLPEDLRRLAACKVCTHHAGMSRFSRHAVENLFLMKELNVLVCTSTLAWGVNLPAHSVVVFGTRFYDPERGCDTQLSILDVVQMFGRAGRPQFCAANDSIGENLGKAILVTDAVYVPHYLRQLRERTPIESRLLSRLPDVLNAEVYLRNVEDQNAAVEWLRGTFLWQRMLSRGGAAYGMSSGKSTLRASSVLAEAGEAVTDYTELALRELQSAALIKRAKTEGEVARDITADPQKIAAEWTGQHMRGEASSQSMDNGEAQHSGREKKERRQELRAATGKSHSEERRRNTGKAAARKGDSLAGVQKESSVVLVSDAYNGTPEMTFQTQKFSDHKIKRTAASGADQKNARLSHNPLRSALHSTPFGRVAATYYVSYRTMHSWLSALECQRKPERSQKATCSGRSESPLVDLLLQSEELSEVQERSSEGASLRQMWDRLVLRRIMRSGNKFEECPNAKLRIMFYSFINFLRMPLVSLELDLQFLLKNLERMVPALLEVLLVFGRREDFAELCEFQRKIEEAKQGTATVPLTARVEVRQGARGEGIAMFADMEVVVEGNGKDKDKLGNRGITVVVKGKDEKRTEVVHCAVSNLRYRDYFRTNCNWKQLEVDVFCGSQMVRRLFEVEGMEEEEAEENVLSSSANINVCLVPLGHGDRRELLQAVDHHVARMEDPFLYVCTHRKQAIVVARELTVLRALRQDFRPVEAGLDGTLSTESANGRIRKGEGASRAVSIRDAARVVSKYSLILFRGCRHRSGEEYYRVSEILALCSGRKAVIYESDGYTDYMQSLLSRSGVKGILVE